jgi:predicted kinase
MNKYARKALKNKQSDFCMSDQDSYIETEENITNNKRLIITVGLPRSGKSTWAIKSGHPIVNRNAIRLALHGEPYIQKAKAMVTAIEEYMVESLFIAGNNTVVVDATHTTEKRRKRWLDLYEGKIDIEIKVFDTSAKECTRRALENMRTDLIPVIERMDEKSDFRSLTKLKYGVE